MPGGKMWAIHTAPDTTPAELHVLATADREKLQQHTEGFTIACVGGSHILIVVPRPDGATWCIQTSLNAFLGVAEQMAERWDRPRTRWHGGAGGDGERVQQTLAPVGLATEETLVIGGGGAPGSDGEASSFGTHVHAAGGAAGPVSNLEAAARAAFDAYNGPWDEQFQHLMNELGKALGDPRAG